MRKGCLGLLVSFLLSTSLILSGCGKAGTPAGPEAASPPLTPPAQEGLPTASPAVLPPAPDFTVTAVDGTAFTLSQHRGKVVALMATASWCTSCIPEVQTLARIDQEYRGRGVEVLILSVWPGETDQELLRFRDRVGGGRHGWAVDKAGLFARTYQIRVLGTTLIIDREGRVAYRDEGATAYQTYQGQIEKLL